MLAVCERALQLVMFGLAIAAYPAHSGPSASRLDQCMNATGGVTANMRDCYGIEIQIEDARLNQAYKMVMQRLTPSRRATLRQSERSWIKARASRCNKQADAEGGGTLALLVNDGCWLEETIARRQFLDSYR